MSAPTLHAVAPASTGRGLRLRLKPGNRASGFVHGAWWPRSTHLITELPALLSAIFSRLGRVDRVIYDENSWAPTPLRFEFRAHSVILDGSRDQPINTLSVIGEPFGKLVLLVVPPYTNPSHAYSIVMAAASPDDFSTADELLGVTRQEAEDRNSALMAHQRWETEGGALEAISVRKHTLSAG